MWISMDTKMDIHIDVCSSDVISFVGICVWIFALISNWISTHRCARMISGHIRGRYHSVAVCMDKPHGLHREAGPGGSGVSDTLT